MSIEFENPLTAGTVLVREQIQSQNYDPGNLGWVIKANGDAEFNSIVIRGSTVIGGTALYYDGAPALGNLIMSIAADAGTDPFGNDYDSGATVYNPSGTKIQLSAAGASAQQSFTPADLVGSVWDEGVIGTVVSNVYDGNVNVPGLFLTSPRETSNLARSTIYMYGSSDTANECEIWHTSDTHRFVQGDVVITDDVTASNIQSGSFSITPTVAGQWTSNAAVSFPHEFANTPVVMVTPSGGGPGTGTTTALEWQVTGTTTTGFNCRILRGNTTATTLSYLAIST